MIEFIPHLSSRKSAHRKGAFSMSKKRMISTRFWSDPWVVDELDPLARYLFLYLLTNEKTNVAGVYELSIRTMSNETGIEKDMLLKMLERLESRVIYFMGWVIFRKSIKHQNYKSPKIAAALARELTDVPSDVIQYISMPSDLSKLLFEEYGIDTVSIPYASGITPNLTKPNLTKPDAAGLVQKPAAPEPSTKHSQKDSKEIFDFYVKTFALNPNQIKLTDKRKSKIKARLSDAGREMLFKAITNTANSPFHRGDNDRGWKADIDFIVRSYEQVERLSVLESSGEADPAGRMPAPSLEQARKLMEKW